MLIHIVIIIENKNGKTGTKCLETASYCCEKHPYIEKFVQKEDYFPQCDQRNIPHDTVWSKIVKRL